MGYSTPATAVILRRNPIVAAGKAQIFQTREMRDDITVCVRVYQDLKAYEQPKGKDVS